MIQLSSFSLDAANVNVKTFFVYSEVWLIRLINEASGSKKDAQAANSR
jgi:hypothetical protein